MSGIFGSCRDLFVTWDDTLFDANGARIVRFYSAEDPDVSVDLCLDPIKEATLNGEPVEIVNGVLQLEDMFGSGVISGTPGSPDHTLTLTMPGQAPVEICLSPVKTVTGDGVDNADPQNPVITQGTVADQENGLSGIVTDFDGNSCEFLKASAYEDSGSTAVPSDEDGDGVVDTHTITTSDDVETPVCLNPVKTVTGDGVDNTDPANPVVASATVADQANGVSGIVTDVNNNSCEFLKASAYTPSTTVPDELGVFNLITTSDGEQTQVCLNPVKSVSGPFVDNTDPQNPILGVPADLRIIDIRIVEGPDGTYNWEVDVGPGDGTVTETLNAGPVIDTDTFGTAVDNGDGTTTQTNPDNTTLVSCNTPVKSVTGDGVDNTDPQNPVISASAVDLVCPDGSNKATLQVDEGPVVPLLKGLLKCSDAGPVALDCDVDEVRIEGRVRVTRSEPLPTDFIDPACIPTIEACDKEGDRVYVGGITFEVIDGAWLPVAVSGDSSQTVGAGEFVQELGLAIPPLTSAWRVHHEATVEYTNDSCVCKAVHGSMRSIANHIMAPDQHWVTRWIMGATGGTGPGWDGTPQMSSDSFGYPDLAAQGMLNQPGGTIQSDIYRKLMPGQTITLTARAESRAPNNFFVADERNQLGVGNTRLTIDCSPAPRG